MTMQAVHSAIYSIKEENSYLKIPSRANIIPSEHQHRMIQGYPVLVCVGGFVDRRLDVNIIKRRNPRLVLFHNEEPDARQAVQVHY